jgi:alkylation response protein AidB-like acyl-CoA dehydrogenase
MMTPAPEIEAARARARQVIAAWQSEQGAVARSDAWMRGFDRGFSRRLAQAGLIGLTWPREYGGAGLSNVVRLTVTEELLRSGAPIAAHWIGDRQIGPAILRHGSERLRKELLPPIVAGETVYCLGLSEPDAGSDLASVRTRARRAGDGWAITGRKVWTSHAHEATHAYVLARTDSSGPKHAGLSEFIVDMGSPGIEVSPIRDMAGESHFNEVTFDDVHVPGWRLVGTEGNGWKQVLEQLAFERGGPERYLSSYALLRELITVAGSPPAGRPGVSRDVQEQLGRLVAQLATLRRIAWDVALRLDEDAPPIDDAVALKYLGNEFENAVVAAARRVAGRDGGGPLFQATLLASPGFSIRGGAADVLLGLLARSEAR